MARDLRLNKKRYVYEESIENIKLSDYEKYCNYGCTATEDTFEMISIFPYPNGKGVEVWIIDHNKKLRNISDEL